MSTLIEITEFVLRFEVLCAQCCTLSKTCSRMFCSLLFLLILLVSWSPPRTEDCCETRQTLLEQSTFVFRFGATGLQPVHPAWAPDITASSTNTRPKERATQADSIRVSSHFEGSHVPGPLCCSTTAETESRSLLLSGGKTLVLAKTVLKKQSHSLKTCL